ncbi:MFS transporter [Chondromyces crocatus]|uniref:Transporter n=1 Tax=Chondromyces crocatus TaxID=52 RepID=A0A0K1EIR3_CHOCO|nr:MFS transporter [Chondromyces crocatus]AKT40756.1 transporter [Chondromyces crocatus]
MVHGASAPGREERAITARDRVVLGLLAVVTALLFADQNLMAPNLTQIAAEFGFDAVERDTKLGSAIAAAFFLVGGLMSVGAGYLTDRFPRKWLFVGVVVVGEIPCLWTGFVRSYEELFVARMLTGIGLGAAMPLLYSLLGDYFSARVRASASAVTTFAMGIGIAGGQVLAGAVGPEHGWRLPFVLVAAPNFVLAGVVALVMREPQRGGAEAVQVVSGGQNERVALADWKALLRVRTNALLFLQGLPGCVPWGMLFTFWNDYFAQDKGLGVGPATLLVMVVGGAVIGGSLLGGLLGNHVYRRRPNALPVLCGVAAIVGVLPALALINTPAHTGDGAPGMGALMGLGAVMGLVISIPSANIRAMLVNVNPPAARGSVFGLFNLADDLGKGLGPFLIGPLVAVLGRTGAFNVAASLWVLCGLALLAAGRTFAGDQEAMEAGLRARQGG